MPWYWIALIVYGGINLIIATLATIAFKRLGYFGVNKWGMVKVYISLIFIGLPLVIISRLKSD